MRGSEPGPLFCAVLKNGRLVRDSQGQLQGLSGSAVWAICQERGRKAGILPSAPHDLRRTWTGDLLGPEPGTPFCAVLKNGRLVHDVQGPAAGLERLQRLAICQERGRNAGIPPPAPHDLRRTWTADLLEEGIDLATVQKLAVQRQSTAVLNVPFKATDA